MKTLTRFLILTLPVFIGYSAYGQHKIPMDHSIYADWKYAQEVMITGDGSFVGYEVKPGKGDGYYCIYNVKTGSTDTIPRAYNVVVGNGSGFLAGKIAPREDQVRKARVEKKNKNEFPHDSLFVYDLNSGKKVYFADVASFSIPGEESAWFAFRHVYKKNDNEGKDSLSGKENNKIFNRLCSRYKPSTLVLYNAENNQSFSYDEVYDYSLSDNGKLLVFQQLVKDSLPVTVTYAMNIPDEQLNIIREGQGLTWNTATDKAGMKAAFSVSTDTADISGLELYYWELGNPEAAVIVDSATSGMSAGWGVNRYGNLWFSDSGNRLFLGTSFVPCKESEDTLLEDEKPHLDVWSWQDPFLQPQQKRNLESTRKKNFLAMFDLGEKRFIQLADSAIERVTTLHGGEGEYVLGSEPGPFERQSSWEGGVNRNIWLINTSNGERKKILDNAEGSVRLSPGDKYVVYYTPSDSTWYAYIIETGEIVSLTGDIRSNFYNEENDVPKYPRSYGLAGFTDNDQYVLLYDRYDIWSVDPAGRKKPFCLTSGYGRQNHTRLFYVKLDPDEQSVSLKMPMYLSTFNERTMQMGYAYLYPSGRTSPRQVLQSMDAYTSLQKAKDRETFIYRKENFKDYPDIYLTDDKFGASTRVSEVNPQASGYLWGEPKLVHWTSYTGEELKGILYTPENLDPSKKYPMLVYFYEKSSDRLYIHRIPSPSRSIINIPWCTSNGYVVFVPDITYRIGHPGQSAYDAVVSGSKAMARQNAFIDSTRIGIQGQSWGGYQVAYLVTRTNYFRAAMAGAPVSNMTSAYGGIRWGTGMSRMFQYEQTQSRLGATLWEKPELYIENSPLFSVPKIHTPLLIMHNDNDGAVPWYQGIEFFTALRRLNKPAWMLSYNNEGHNLSKWPDRVDLSIRMMQFFDYYLKGKPEPVWMSGGIPAVKKGIDLGYELVK